MNLFAHAGPGGINTWGFAFTGGVIGLFSVSLLYVRSQIAPVAPTSDRVSIVQLVAALGRVSILIGGVCGASLGLGLAGVLDAGSGDTAQVSEIVDRVMYDVDATEAEAEAKRIS